MKKHRRALSKQLQDRLEAIAGPLPTGVFRRDGMDPDEFEVDESIPEAMTYAKKIINYFHFLERITR